MYKVSENIVNAIEAAGWEITDDPIERTEGNSKVICLSIRTQGYLDEDYNDVIYYDGTDEDFEQAVREMSRNFSVEEYAEDMSVGAPEYDNPDDEPSWTACGECIKSALNDLADACEN